MAEMRTSSSLALAEIFSVNGFHFLLSAISLSKNFSKPTERKPSECAHSICATSLRHKTPTLMRGDWPQKNAKNTKNLVKECQTGLCTVRFGRCVNCWLANN